MNNSIKFSKSSLFLSVVSIFVLILVLVNFVRVIRDGDYLSFTSFLEWLSTIRDFNISFDINSLTTSVNWGIFNGLRDFLNALGTCVGFSIWFITNIINCLIFVFQFVVFIIA